MSKNEVNTEMKQFLKEGGNILDLLEDSQIEKLGDYVALGSEVDDHSRELWLKRNLEAIDLIKHIEDPNLEVGASDTIGTKGSKIVYPLLTSAIMHAASRLIPHFVRNGTVCDVAVHGEDPTGAKHQRAENTAAYVNWQLLSENDSWLKECHKLAHMLMTWGMGFRRVFYDPDAECIDFQLIPPADIIINHNLTTLKKATRITIRHFMSEVELVEKMRSGEFKEIDTKLLLGNDMENGEADSQEDPAMHEVYEQYCRFDLDDDGYAEPLRVFYHVGSSKLLAVHLNFVLGDVQFNDAGKVRKIPFSHNIVDYHCMDDPEGGYYSLGLNHILFHPNKVINTLNRQIVDSGTLANQQGGFYTEAFKTSDKHLKFKKGQFQKVSISPGQRISDNIMPLPFKEPSQVLYSFLGMMTQNAKELGFITDALTGESTGQNVPATTMLAIVEQSTRAFKPVVQKLQMSLTQEFKLIFKLNAKYLKDTKYMKFLDKSFYITKEDFSLEDYDVCPVADPTESSEAHKFARVQAMFQLLQLQLPYVDGMRIVKDYMDVMGVDNPMQYIVPMQPQQQPPDPKMMKVIADTQINQGKLQIAAREQARKERETAIKEEELTNSKLTTFNKLDETNDKRAKSALEAHKGGAELGVQLQLAKIAQEKVINERRRLDIMEKQSRDKGTAKGDKKGT